MIFKIVTFSNKSWGPSVLRASGTSAMLWKLCSGELFQDLACLYRADLRHVVFGLGESFGCGLDIAEIVNDFKKVTFLNKSWGPSVLRVSVTSANLWKLSSGKLFQDLAFLYRTDSR